MAKQASATGIVEAAVRLCPRLRGNGHDGSNLAGDLCCLTGAFDAYCQAVHARAPRQPVSVELPDGTEVTDGTVTLCRACCELLSHAVVKRSRCPHQPKPECRDCPAICYAPRYHEQIRQVMRVAGDQRLAPSCRDHLEGLVF